MEKLGVEFDTDKVKEADASQKPGTCPQCGAKLEADGQKCPTCGTEPFEKREGTKE